MSSKTYVFEDKMTKYQSVLLLISFCGVAKNRIRADKQNQHITIERYLLDPDRIVKNNKYFHGKKFCSTFLSVQFSLKSIKGDNKRQGFDSFYK